jgi:hypothetical protein
MMAALSPKKFARIFVVHEIMGTFGGVSAISSRPSTTEQPAASSTLRVWNSRKPFTKRFGDDNEVHEQSP